MRVPDWLIEAGDRIARVLAVVALVLASAVMVHQHSRQADRAPYVAIDDSLANVSASMVALGRNGFPASPVQALAGELDPRRHDVQLNYGFGPFLLGAGLDWLFGTSYPALRAIHVVGLILSIAVATAVFWRQSLPAALLFAGVVATSLWPTQWPMFRPDIGVALAGIGAVACATAALQRNSALAWLGTGFLAATAFGSHQIAWAMVLWAGIMWLAAVALAEREQRWSDVTIGPLIAVVSGGLLGIVAYLHGISWRVTDVIGLWSHYSASLMQASPKSYSDNLAQHLQYAWSDFRPIWLLRLLHAGILVGLLATVVLWWRGSPLARPVAAYMLPGALAALGYMLSLGAYRNHHAGYVLLLQLATVWAGAAALAALLVAARAKLGNLSRPIHTGIVVIGAVTLAHQAQQLAIAGTAWTIAGERYVAFSDYEGRVLAEVSPGTAAIGDLLFGLRSGVRHHLVQTGDAITLLKHSGETARAQFAPDHLVLRDYTQAAASKLVTEPPTIPDRQAPPGHNLHGAGSLLDLPDVRYGETAIVSAYPYGETRVYSRDGTGRPAVSIFDSQAQIWRSRFMPASFASQDSAPVEMVLTDLQKRIGADLGSRIRVEPGTYLVEVAAPSSAMSLLSASPTAALAIDRAQVNWLGDASVAVVLPGMQSVYLILRAPHGVGYIGYFGPPTNAALEIKRIEQLVVNPRRTTPLAVPPLSQWQAQVSGGRLAVAADGTSATITGVGIPVGYQLMSPPIAVEPHTEITARFDVTSTGVQVGLGFLDDKGMWIASAVGSGPLTINTGASTKVQLLVTNFEARSSPEPARFELRWQGAEVSSAYDPKRLYVDAIARCWSPPAAVHKIEACRK